MKRVKEHNRWIYSPLFDLTFILAPPFIVTGVVLSIPSFFERVTDVPLWAWVALVMCIDVAHVYSTLFRTYFDREELSARPVLYASVPVLCWLCGVLLYSIGPRVFWRTLAYVAVFHFIRQQYGFMMVYMRKAGASSPWMIRLDKCAIYIATLYPIVYWHTKLPRNFSWLIDDDFVSLPFWWLERGAFIVYMLTLGIYALKEAYFYARHGSVSVGKNLLILGTVLSWYVGIVTFNGDMAFTLTNVVSHGVPYMALVWVYGRSKWSRVPTSQVERPIIGRMFSIRTIPLFVVTLLGFAYLEEFLWDTLVWRERGEIFLSWFKVTPLGIPSVTDGATLSWLVPLLALPQITHYVLDGFIWRLRKPDLAFKDLLAIQDGV